MTWRGEGKRHSLASKGVKTHNITKEKLKIDPNKITVRDLYDLEKVNFTPLEGYNWVIFYEDVMDHKVKDVLTEERIKDVEERPASIYRTLLETARKYKVIE